MTSTELVDMFNVAFEADGQPEQGIGDIDPGNPNAATVHLALAQLQAGVATEGWTVTVKAFGNGREEHFPLDEFLAANEEREFIINAAALAWLYRRVLIGCKVYDPADPGDLCNIPFIPLDGAGTCCVNTGLSVW